MIPESSTTGTALSEQNGHRLAKNPTGPDQDSPSQSKRPNQSRFRISELFGETTRQTGLLFSAYLGSMAAGFVSTAVQVRFMEPSEMGRFVFCLSLMLIGGMIFEFGIFSAGGRILALAKDQHHERTALGGLVLLATATGLLFSLFIVAVAVPVELVFKQDVRWLLISAAAFAFFQPFQWLIELGCQGLNRIRVLSQFQLLMGCCQALLLIVLAATGLLTAGSALVAYFIPIGVAALWSLARLRPTFSGALVYIKLTMKETRGYGFNVYLARLTTSAYSRIDSLVITYFVGIAPLGLYAAAQKLSNLILTISRVVAITRFRVFARLDKIPSRLNRWNGAVLVISSLSLVAAGPLAIRIAFPRYQEAIPLLLPFALAAFFGGLFQPYNAFLSSHGRGADLRNIAVSVTIAGLAGLMLLVPLTGIKGAAWAGAGAMALDFVLHLYYYRRLRAADSRTGIEPLEITPLQTEAIHESGNSAQRQYVPEASETLKVDAPDSASLDEYKLRAREQWTADPCGSHVARGLPFGTREYFDAIEDYRYGVFGPWIKNDLGFGSHPGERLLEVGCGMATDLLQFARGGSRVIGIDITPRSIEIARKRFEVYDLDGAFAIGDAENLAFPDHSFDLVYSFGVLHHTPNTERAIEEIRRVLRPGGQAIVMLYNRSSLYYWGSIFLKHGLLRGEIFGSSLSEIMSRRVEYSEVGATPLVKAYTHAEARKLFSLFDECRIQVRQLTRDSLGLPGRLLPQRVFRWLERTLGWNLVITATKSK
jgi:O-antigen/teichoic acid export membrane protein/ubiquinone/menaquinone biosynthesis C-methylase UbiE